MADAMVDEAIGGMGNERARTTTAGRVNRRRRPFGDQHAHHQARSRIDALGEIAACHAFGDIAPTILPLAADYSHTHFIARALPRCNIKMKTAAEMSRPKCQRNADAARHRRSVPRP